MDKSTPSTFSGSAADAAAAIPTISMPSPESEARLRALVAERGPALRIRLRTPADFDLTGHQVTGTSLTLDLVAEDDTEGHTINLHFPKWEDARQFERRLIATGAIVGTLVIAGGGLALSQALPDAEATTSTQAQVESATGGRAASDSTFSGAISPSTGGALTGKEEALLRVITGPDAVVTSGQAGTSSVASGYELTGKEEGLLRAVTGPDAIVTSGQAGTSSVESGYELTGKEEGLLRAITGPDAVPQEDEDD